MPGRELVFKHVVVAGQNFPLYIFPTCCFSGFVVVAIALVFVIKPFMHNKCIKS